MFRQPTRRRLVYPAYHPGASIFPLLEASADLRQAYQFYPILAPDEPDAENSAEYADSPPCSNCRSATCASKRCRVTGVRMFRASDVSESDNKLANSLFRRLFPTVCTVCLHDVLEGGAAVPEWTADSAVFVPPCHPSHAVCAKCFFRCLCKSGDLAGVYDCAVCRARIALPVRRLWLVCLLASGAEADSVREHELGPRARCLLQVGAGTLCVHFAARLIGGHFGPRHGDAETDHDPGLCAVPACMQCAVLSGRAPAPRRRGAWCATSPRTWSKQDVVALVHLTPGVPQAALVAYATALAESFLPEQLLATLDHEPRLIAHLATLAAGHWAELLDHIRRVRAITMQAERVN